VSDIIYLSRLVGSTCCSDGLIHWAAPWPTMKIIVSALTLITSLLFDDIDGDDDWEPVRIKSYCERRQCFQYC